MNIAQVLKAEITRLSKKEAKVQNSPTKATTIQLKKSVADLKSRLATLEKSNKELQKQVESLVAAVPKPVEDAEVKGRISGKGVKSLRKKMGLSQAEFGKLVGVSTGAVVQWEKKQGTLKLRQATLKAIIGVKGLGKKEARKRLDEVAPMVVASVKKAGKKAKKTKKVKKASVKTRK